MERDERPGNAVAIAAALSLVIVVVVVIDLTHQVEGSQPAWACCGCAPALGVLTEGRDDGSLVRGMRAQAAGRPYQFVIKIDIRRRR